MRAAGIVQVLVASTLLARAELVLNGDFDGDFQDTGVATGWVNDCWSSRGDYDVVFSRETTASHSGSACQRMTCRRIGYIDGRWKGHIGFGAVQLCPGPPIELRKGVIYRVSAWLPASPALYP